MHPQQPYGHPQQRPAYPQQQPVQGQVVQPYRQPYPQQPQQAYPQDYGQQYYQQPQVHYMVHHHQPQVMVSRSAPSGLSTAMNLVLTMATCGAWLPVWLIIDLASRRKTTTRIH